MKQCPNCHAEVSDESVFCVHCGATLNAEANQSQAQQPAGGYQPEQQAQQQQQQYNGYNTYPAPPVYNPYDHTAEFDPKDISDNKVISLLIYLGGAFWIIIAAITSNSSPYVAFHIRQSMKFTVTTILTWLVMAILCWTFIVPFAGAIFLIVLAVIKIICFFQVCMGKAKEPAIIRSLGFMK